MSAAAEPWSRLDRLRALDRERREILADLGFQPLEMDGLFLRAQKTKGLDHGRVVRATSWRQLQRACEEAALGRWAYVDWEEAP